MTPFGAKLREIRSERGVTQAQMAKALDVTPSYLSALERGKRGIPSFELVQKLTLWLGFIWDEADELAELAAISHPRVVLDTSETTPERTAFANLLARHIATLDLDDIVVMRAALDKAIRMDRRVRRELRGKSKPSETS